MGVEFGAADTDADEDDDDDDDDDDADTGFFSKVNSS